MFSRFPGEIYRKISQLSFALTARSDKFEGAQTYRPRRLTELDCICGVIVAKVEVRLLNFLNIAKTLNNCTKGHNIATTCFHLQN